MDSPDDELNEYFELLAAQSFSSGVLKDSHQPEPSRENLVQCLQQIVQLLVQYDRHRDTVKPLDVLLQLESATGELREISDEFLRAQREKISEMSTFFAELKSMNQMNNYCQKAVVQSGSLLAAYRKKNILEVTTVQQVLEGLKCLYDATKMKPLAKDLSRAAELLSGKFLGNPHYENISSLIDCWRRHGLSRRDKQEKHDSPSRPNGSPELEEQSKSHRPMETIDRITGRGLSKQDLLVFPTKQYPFLRHWTARGIYKVLLVGPEGSGKTYTCNQLALSAEKNWLVLRLSMSGRTVGEAEDMIVSFFHSAGIKATGYLLLIDDLDSTMVLDNVPGMGGGLDEQIGKHSTTRALSTFLDMMDCTTECRIHPESSILVIATASSKLNTHIARFDEVFLLELPNFFERKSALVNLFGISDDTGEKQPVLDDLATCSAGMSYAELSQSCRRAIMAVKEEPHAYSRALEVMQDMLQSLAPASLRSEDANDFVDMRVLASADLLHDYDGQTLSCPLIGRDIDAAWKELESLIVVPLCRGRALDQLLHRGKQMSMVGVLCGGVLLTGASGCGKTTLARHCATFAASLSPSVKMLEASCTSLIQKEVGASERAIRRLFDCARSAAPCIVILDDIATIASLRGLDETTEGTFDRVLSTLLTELDGIDRGTTSSRQGMDGIAVIGVTQNEKWVDPALLRPGRLGKTIRLNVPDRETRRLVALKELDSLMLEEEEECSFTSAKLTYLAEVVADTTKNLGSASVIALCNDAKRWAITQFVSDYPDNQQLLASVSDFIQSLLHEKA